MAFSSLLRAGRTTPFTILSRPSTLQTLQTPIIRQTLPKLTRFASKTTQFIKSSKPIPPPLSADLTSKKPLYPTRLLVYHSGTPRTVFIGCLKVTTIFLAAFFTLIVAPTQLSAPDLPYFRFTSTLLTGLAPLAFVSFTTAPFVSYIHLRLPNYARMSKEMLTRYLRTLPKNGEMDVTTITLIGRPRVQRYELGDLKAVQPKLLNVANFKSDKLDKTRPWWAGKGQRSYAIGEAKGKSREGWVWDVVAQAIRENKLREPVAGKKSADVVQQEAVKRAREEAKLKSGRF